jgi:hypothetical protein
MGVKGQIKFEEVDVCDLLPTTLSNSNSFDADCTFPTSFNRIIGSSNGSTFFWDFPMSQSEFSNEIIHITSNLVVKTNLKFSSCNVFIDAGVTITLSPSASETGGLKAFESNFTSCGNMWNGFVENKNAYIAFCGGSIKNANVGVTLNKDYLQNSFFVGVTFIGNPIGLKNGTATTVNFKAFNTNTFQGNSMLTISGVSQGVNAIQLDNCTSDLGTLKRYDLIPGQFFPNEIYNYDFGVKTFKTTLKIRNFNFTKCSFSNGLNGAGIYSEEGNLQIDPVINTEGIAEGVCYFEGCLYTSVHTKNNRNTRVIHTFIGEGKCRFGIWSERTKTLNAVNTISDNDIYNTGGIYGIWVQRPQGSFSALTLGKIERNTIDMGTSSITTQDEWAGIRVSTPYPAIDKMSVSRNTISINGTYDDTRGISIDVGLAQNFKVIRNVISMIGELRYEKNYGIYLYNGLLSKGNEVSGNIVEGQDRRSHTCGIHIENLPKVTSCDNKVDKIYRGLHFVGNNDLSVVSSNHIYEHAFGLQIDGSSRIGPQFKTGNEWLSTYTLPHLASGNLGNPELSRFTVESDLPIDLPTPRDPDGDAWFDFQAEGDPKYCTPPPPFAEKPELSPFDIELLSGEIEMKLTIAQLWDEQRLLLIRLLENPNWLSQNTELKAFWEQNYGTSAYKFAEIENLIVDLSKWSTEEIAQLDAIELSITDKQDKLTTLVNGEFNELSVANMSSISVELSELSNKYQTLSEDIKATHFIPFIDLMDKANALSQATQHESNKRWVLIWQIKRLLEESLTSEDLLQARNIAEQCVQEGGYATREAVAFVPEADQGLFTKDEFQPCGLTAPRAVKSQTIPEMLIVPNPASESIEINLSSSNLVHWDIIGSDGLIKKSGTIVEKQSNLIVKTANFTDGVYILRFKDEKGLIKQSRFVIIH